MTQPHELTRPLDAIVFDCDGTLSHIEGIDELAKMNGVGQQVAQLTAQAMGGSGLTPELFQTRLNLVMPTSAQVSQLGEMYFKHISPDLIFVLNHLQSLGKQIYIVSAGLLPAVADFGKRLGIDLSHIFAVDIYFDQLGRYQSFDSSSQLIYGDGKRSIVQLLLQQHSRLAYIGDGMNDYSVYDLVTRFIGYGGAFYRQTIEKHCQFYLRNPSFKPLISLCLTAEEIKKLNL